MRERDEKKPTGYFSHTHMDFFCFLSIFPIIDSFELFSSQKLVLVSSFHHEKSAASDQEENRTPNPLFLINSLIRRRHSLPACSKLLLELSSFKFGEARFCQQKVSDPRGLRLNEVVVGRGRTNSRSTGVL